MQLNEITLLQVIIYIITYININSKQLKRKNVRKKY